MISVSSTTWPLVWLSEITVVGSTFKSATLGLSTNCGIEYSLSAADNFAIGLGDMGAGPLCLSQRSKEGENSKTPPKEWCVGKQRPAGFPTELKDKQGNIIGLFEVTASEVIIHSVKDRRARTGGRTTEGQNHLSRDQKVIDPLATSIHISSPGELKLTMNAVVKGNIKNTIAGEGVAECMRGMEPEGSKIQFGDGTDYKTNGVTCGPGKLEPVANVKAVLKAAKAVNEAAKKAVDKNVENDDTGRD